MMEDLKHSIKALLLASDAILEEFEDKFTLTPIRQTTAGYSKSTRRYSYSESAFQIEGNRQTGTVRAVETLDGVTDLEVYVGEKMIVVSLMETELANIIRAFILADDQLRRLFGNNICVTQLARGNDLTTTVEGQELAKTFASYQVQGSKQMGVASIAAFQYRATELILYVGEETIHMEPCPRTLKSFCYPRWTDEESRPLERPDNVVPC